AVGTTDEQDEPKNRRAQYILAIDGPTMTNAPFPPKWQRL
ncbi:MAG: OmpA family protein, partial [Archangium sp.]|nr:OmpA family protein [Archangium sp.]